MERGKYQTLSAKEIAETRKIVRELERYQDKKTGEFVIKSDTVRKVERLCKMAFTLKYLLIHIKDIDLDNDDM